MFDLCRKSVLFQMELQVCSLLALFLGCTSLVILRMISNTEDTLDITVSFFLVALVCQVVTYAFDASRL
jgi:hypothetical protein